MEEALLAQAIVREDWEAVARCLLVGVARTLDKLPDDSLEGLLDILSGRKHGPRRGRREGAQEKEQ